ncbi:MAG: M18 family aminopeptidase [Lachnospiraceae bacterium]|nr:M18 family aminopeptidase [Lachnospiraceae bacterium]
MSYLDTANNLLETVERCVSPFHVVKYAEEKLAEKGFGRLEMDKKWKVTPGGKYFINVYDTSFVAFTVGEEFEDKKKIRIATAHNDFPCLRIKPKCDIKDGNYIKLNVEVYGGAILSTWFDRPLSVAGKIVTKGENEFSPKVMLVDLKKPILVLPNLAPHINRDINKGYEYNKQKDMLPIMDVVEDDINEEGYLLKCIADRISVEPEDILDMELIAYQYDEGCIVGANDTMISSPRLDNITSVEACLYGIANGTRNKGINLIAMFDNEEIGSGSKQGAGSLILNMILEKIYLSLGRSREEFLTDIAEGIIISSDVAHCYHPNYSEKNDVTMKAMLNSGVVIKKDSMQKYANDSEGVAIVKVLCEKAGVKSQLFSNRSDATGGSTLGSIISKSIPMRTVDVGVPLLAMHSARELMGVEDQEALNLLVKQLFS